MESSEVPTSVPNDIEAIVDLFDEAQQCFEVLISNVDLSSAFHAVSKVLSVLDKVGVAFPRIGAAICLLEDILPDSKTDERAEILRRFEKLYESIDQVSDEIRNLEKLIKWEVTKLEYAVAVNRIQMAMQFSLEMGKANKADDKYKRFQQRLKEVCSNQEMTLALDALLDGIVGKGLFYSSILDGMFSETGGHRPKISALAFRLLQLVSGGMTVLATYEASVRGHKGADEMVKLYEPRAKQAKSKIDEVLQRCMKDFRANMLEDINHVLDSGEENEKLCEDMFKHLKEKYDWLETKCVVYNDLKGFDNHWFSGSRVESLHRNGKCAIVFYRTAADEPKCSDKLSDTKRIVAKYPDWFWRADKRHNAIIDDLRSAEIGWTGCAVIWSRVSERNNLSSATVLRVNQHATTIVILE